MNLTGEWMALPECDFALRYDGEELAIETVLRLQWHIDTELPKRCTSIELPSKKIDTNTAQLLSSIALQCRHLHTVDISNNQIRDEGAMTLAESMKLLSREINYLDISGNLLTERSAGQVAEAFLKQGSKGHSEPTLPREGAPVPLLDLSDNVLKDAGVQLVASHICSCVRLRLRNVGCGKEGVRALLQKKQFLAELDLGSNPIGKFGVYDLCTAIQSEIRWVSLNISYLEGLSGTANAEMSANLVTPIKSCLSNSGLRDLDCSGNGLGDSGASEVVEAIRDRDTFERLAMNNSGCGILVATVLKDVLAVRPGRALRVLELRGNALNDDCMRVFAKGLALSTSLEILILAENLITCPGVKSLAEGLKLQRRLEGDRSSVIELDLSGNTLGIEAAEVLAEAAHKDLMTQRKAALKFEVPWGLEKLHLKNCQIHGDLLKVADAMLQRVLLLKEAAEAMSPEVVEMIKERRARQPHSLEVLGLFEASDNDPRQFFEPIRLDAELKLKEKWPELAPLKRTVEPVPEPVPETLPETPAASTAVARKELPMAAPADSGVSTCTEIPVMRLDDDSDQEHSPYAEVDGDDEDSFEGKGDVNSVDASKHHRMDLHDTPGSIRDLDELDAWYDDVSPANKKAMTNSNGARGSIRVLDALENWYDDGSQSPPGLPPPKSSSPFLPRPSSTASMESSSMRDGSESPVSSAPKGKGKAKGPPGLPPPKSSSPFLPRPSSTASMESSSMRDGSESPVSSAPKGKGKAKGPPGLPPKSSSLSLPGPSSSVSVDSSSMRDGSESPVSSPPLKAVEKGPKGKGKGKGPACPKGKGAPPPAKGPGKGPALPPAKGGPKAKGEGKAKAAPRLQGNAPLGRKIHWGAHYEEPHADSVFSGLNHEVLFNPDLLKEMLSAESAPAVTRRKSLAKKPAGISILDGSRAQNLAIVMSKMKVSTEEFCQNLKELNFSEECMSPDDVELLIHVLPTAEENKKLIEYKDRVADLRDVEQNVMPFCVLHKGVVRMKVAKFALSHVTMYQAVKDRCEVLKLASEQVRTSVQFREMLGVVLKVGNFINHGVKEMVEGAIRGISVESLSSLASFKTGAVSTMHFLCLSFMSKDINFFQDLKVSMSHVHEASKEKFVLLKGSIEAFASEVEMAKRQLLSLLDEDDPELALGDDREADLRLVISEWVKEKDDLQEAGEEAFKACCESQKYFSISDRAQADPNASEAFFVHIANFLDLFQEAWLEIQRNPRKWDDFAEKAGLQLQREKRRSSIMTQVNSDGRSTESATGSTTVARRSSLRRGDSAMQARPSQRRLSTRDSVSRRPVAFVASLSGGDLPPRLEVEASKQITRSLLNSVYSAVAQKRLDCPTVNLRRGSS